MIDEKLITEYSTMIAYLKELIRYSETNKDLDDCYQERITNISDKLLGYITDCYALKVNKSLESD